MITVFHSCPKASFYNRNQASNISCIPMFPFKHEPRRCWRVYVGVNQHGQKTSITTPLPDACYIISYLANVLHLMTRDVHRSSLRRLMCPSQDQFIFLSLLICLLTSLPDPYDSLSVLVYDIEHNPFICVWVDSKFVLCLFCECPGICTMSKLLAHRCCM